MDTTHNNNISTANAGTCRVNIVGIPAEHYKNIGVKAGIDGQGDTIDPLENSTYILPVGTYICEFDGLDEYCSIHKIFTVAENEITRAKDVDIPLIPLENKEAEGKDIIFLYSDQLEKMFYGDEKAMDFTTPAFSPDKNMNQFTSNKERQAFLEDLQGSENYYFFKDKLPLVLLTKDLKDDPTDLTACLKILSASDKLNVMYQAQIHGNEFASGEGALAVIESLCSKQELLDDINIVVCPCVNQEGSAQGTRDYEGINLNRDFIDCESYHLEFLHRVFFELMPEVVIDAHTFTRRNSFFEESLIKAMFDVRMSCAESNNTDDKILQWNSDILEKVMSGLEKEGFRVGYYNNSTDPNIGRIYYSLFGGLSVLFESEGTRSGKFHFRRNLTCQYKGIFKILAYLASNCKEIKETVLKNRQAFLDGSNIGRSYVTLHSSSNTDNQVMYLDEFNPYGIRVRKKARLEFKRYDLSEKQVTIPEEITIDELDFDANIKEILQKNYVDFSQAGSKIKIALNQISQRVILDILEKFTNKNTKEFSE